MNEEELVELALYCENLMREPLFNKLSEQVELNLTHQLLTSKPAEREAREDYYRAFQAFRNLLDTMSAIVATKEQIKAKQDAEAEENND